MSQQEFVPREQRQEQLAAEHNDRDANAQDYWSTRAAGAVPKDEPTATYDEPMAQNDYQSGYTAQDYAALGEQPRHAPPNNAQQAQFQRQHFSPDGDAFEHAYGPQMQSSGLGSVPPWARPQPQRGGMRIFWLIALVLLFLGPMLHFVFGLVAVAAMIIFGLALPFLLFALIGIPFFILRAAKRTGPRRWRDPGSWRQPGPWGW